MSAGLGTEAAVGVAAGLTKGPEPRSELHQGVRPLVGSRRAHHHRGVPGGLLLRLADITSIMLAGLVAYALVAGVLGTRPSFTLHWFLLLIVIPAMIVNHCLHLYDSAASGPIERFRLRVLGGLVLLCLSVGLAVLLQPMTSTLAASLALGSLLSIPAVLAGDELIRTVLIQRLQWGAPAILIGETDDIIRVGCHLRDHPEFGLRPVGFIGPRPLNDHTIPVQHLGTWDELHDIAHLAEVAIFTSPRAWPPAQLSRIPFRRVIVIPNVVDSPSLWLRTRDLGGMLGIEFSSPPATGRWPSARRMLDLVISVPLLIITLPVIAVVAALVFAVDPGRAFYVQRRVGLGGRPINILKIRSMYGDAEQRLQKLLATDADARDQWDRFMKLAVDPRVLPFIGNFIRRTSLDELPQLWNVIRGDIGLVGPRPFPSYHTERFEPDFQMLRSSVQPGLTGLWQVSERSNADLAQQAAIDGFYIRNRSIWLDLYILVRTLPAALGSKGAR